MVVAVRVSTARLLASYFLHAAAIDRQYAGKTVSGVCDRWPVGGIDFCFARIIECGMLLPFEAQ